MSSIFPKEESGRKKKQKLLNSNKKNWVRIRETEHFRLFETDDDGEMTPFYVSVSKKVGNAVRRNRIKRITREFLRLHRDLLPAQKKVLIKVKKIPENPGLTTLESEFLALFKGERQG